MPQEHPPVPPVVPPPLVVGPPVTTQRQVPPRHWFPLTQALLQIPQSLLSLCGDTQVPLQSIWGGRQTTPTHWALVHDWPGWQTRPHAPQLLTSELRLAHAPLAHRVSGVGHEHPFGPPNWQVQAPPSQPEPGGQASPQPPQLFVSIWVSTHLPLHSTEGGKQTTDWHWLLMHAAPVGQG